MIRNIELVKSIGADEVIDYNKEDFRTRRDSFEVVLENIGNCTMSQAQLLLKTNGTSLHVGYKSMKEMMKINLIGKTLGKAVGKSSLIIKAKTKVEDLQTLMEMCRKVE